MKCGDVVMYICVATLVTYHNQKAHILSKEQTYKRRQISPNIVKLQFLTSYELR